MTIAQHVQVRGRVQGVGFRLACERQAIATGVTGWVRNEPDGSVLAVIEGEEPAITSMVGWLRHGPRLAKVTAVDILDVEPAGFRGFQTR